MCMEDHTEGAQKRVESMLLHCVARYIQMHKPSWGKSIRKRPEEDFEKDVYEMGNTRLSSSPTRITSLMQHHTDSRPQLPASNAKVTQQPPAGRAEKDSDLQVSKMCV